MNEEKLNKMKDEDNKQTLAWVRNKKKEDEEKKAREKAAEEKAAELRQRKGFSNNT